MFYESIASQRSVRTFSARWTTNERRGWVSTRRSASAAAAGHTRPLPRCATKPLTSATVPPRTAAPDSFAFHESNTVLEATREAKALNMVVTVLYLD